MVELESQVMLLGIYKSYEELEENLTIAEMNLLLKAKAKDRENHYKVLAAFQGHKWGDDNEGGTGETGEEAMERLARKMDAKLNGASDEQIELEEMGIKFG